MESQRVWRDLAATTTTKAFHSRFSMSSFSFRDLLFLRFSPTAPGNLSHGHWCQHFLSRWHVRGWLCRVLWQVEVRWEMSSLGCWSHKGDLVDGGAPRGPWVSARRLGSDQGHPTSRVEFDYFFMRALSFCSSHFLPTNSQQEKRLEKKGENWGEVWDNVGARDLGEVGY